MSLKAGTRQVPADTLGVGDVCEFGTIVRIDDAEGGDDRLVLVTEDGKFPMSGTRLVWISHQG